MQRRLISHARTTTTHNIHAQASKAIQAAIAMAAAATPTETQLATAATAAVQNLKDVGRLSVDDSVDQHGKKAFVPLTDVTKAVQEEMCAGWA